MTDTEKIELIDSLIADFWENGNVSEDSAISILNAIATVVSFKRKD